MTQAVLSEEEVNAMVAHGVGFIYAITNATSGKKYIGQAKDYRKRWGEHRRALNSGIHVNTHLQSAYNKYGADAFKYEIVAVVRCSMLNDAERHYIATYKAHERQYGYNKTLGGSNGTPTDEIKAKISASCKGRVITQATRLKMSASLKLRWQNPAFRLKHAEATRQAVETPEIRAKYLEAVLKGENNTQAILNNEQAREIYLDHNTVQKVLAEKYNVAHCTISDIQRGKSFTTVTKHLPIHPKHEARLNGKHVANGKTAPRKVAQYTLEGEFIKVWESAQQIKRECGYNSSSGVNACCHGKRKTHKGYVWKFYNEEETAG